MRGLAAPQLSSPRGLCREAHSISGGVWSGARHSLGKPFKEPGVGDSFQRRGTFLQARGGPPSSREGPNRNATPLHTSKLHGRGVISKPCVRARCMSSDRRHSCMDVFGEVRRHSGSLEMLFWIEEKKPPKTSRSKPWNIKNAPKINNNCPQNLPKFIQNSIQKASWERLRLQGRILCRLGAPNPEKDPKSDPQIEPNSFENRSRRSVESNFTSNLIFG